MTDAQKKEVKEYIKKDPVTGEQDLKYRYTSEFIPASVQIAGAAPEKQLDEQSQKFIGYDVTGDLVVLVGTLDSYENSAYQLAGEGSTINAEDEEYVHVNLKDENDYEKAKAFIGLNAGLLSIDEDFYGDMLKYRAGVGAAKIGIAFLSILIGIIALVNMVNTLSTGILNRKSELAAMQCIGMTEGQLYGMTVIECLQYTLTAGVLATGLLEGLMYVMLLLLKKIELDDVFGEMLNFAEPLPRIWIAVAVAFAAALLASFIPLKQMQKESLTDQLRTIE